MSAADPQPIADSELDLLFAPLARFGRVLIAVSGGPDSSALAVLAARWRALRESGPRLFAATVDHRLRPSSTSEAEAAGRLCAALGIAHVILPWTAEKPPTGIQEAARAARYGLLAAHARVVGAEAVALAHTRDDQAETVLFRLARGSGLSGLAAMRTVSERDGIVLVRPLLGMPKARLVASLQARGLPFATDPSNFDVRFARPRLRALAPALAREGLGAERLAVLARRMARADAALEAATAAAQSALILDRWTQSGPLRFDRAGFSALPEEIALRLLERAISQVGAEGPVELAKLEALLARLQAADIPQGEVFRQTLAGAIVTARGGEVRVERAPDRRKTASDRA